MHQLSLTKYALRSLVQAYLHCRHSAGLLQRYTSRNSWHCDKRAAISSDKKLIRRWDSERELSIRRYRTSTVLQNTIDSCINSATDRRGYVLERMFTTFSEITQYNGHYAVQGHSRSPILVSIESSYTTSY